MRRATNSVGVTDEDGNVDRVYHNRSAFGGYYYDMDYDLRGNVTKMATTYGSGIAFKYYWDSRDQLTKATREDGGVEQWAVQYKYDAAGRRVARKKDSGDWNWYHFDGLNVIAEGTDTDDKVWQTTNASPAGGIICRDDNRTKYWYHYDPLGNVVGVTDADGNVSRVYHNRSAFGYHYSNRVYDSSGYDGYHNDVQPYHLTTKEIDANTGLLYFNARWYNAGLGRVISREPTGVDGPNMYHFNFNNPTNRLDPNGEDSKPKGGGRWDKADPRKIRTRIELTQSARARTVGRVGRAGPFSKKCIKLTAGGLLYGAFLKGVYEIAQWARDVHQSTDNLRDDVRNARASISSVSEAERPNVVAEICAGKQGSALAACVLAYGGI